jgi:AraC-like DNA-binding protein
MVFFLQLMSSQKNAKIVQKRSRPPLRILALPVALDAALPIFLHQGYVQRDRPITFLHVHDCLEIGLCHRGSGIFMVGQKVLPFRAGDVSVINHTEVHLAQSAPGTSSEWSWIYLDPIRLATTIDPAVADATAFAGARFNNVLPEEAYPEIARTVRRLIEELARVRLHHVTIVRVLTVELMGLLHRLPMDRTNGTKQVFVHERLGPAMQHLAGHFRDPVDVQLLARQCELSLSHFRRLFQRAIGKSPRAYWLNLRIRMAASLLQATARGIMQISQDVGFESLSSFNRQFLKTIGVTPRAWRKATDERQKHF